MILKPALEVLSLELAHRPGSDIPFLIGSQASTPISEVLTVPNMNF